MYLSFLLSCPPIKHYLLCIWSDDHVPLLLAFSLLPSQRAIEICMQFGVSVFKSSCGDKLSQRHPYVALLIQAIRKVYCNWFGIKGSFLFRNTLLPQTFKSPPVLLFLLNCCLLRGEMVSLHTKDTWVSGSLVAPDICVFSRYPGWFFRFFHTTFWITTTKTCFKSTYSLIWK